MVTKNNIISVENSDIKDLIYTIRGKQVMLDSDLAKLYEVTTKRLNEQVKRNSERFPENFMFQLEREDIDLVRSQIATTRGSKLFTGQDGGRRYKPYVFTEQGIYMLATILKGKVATDITIKLITTFSEMRKIVVNNQKLDTIVKKLEYNQSQQKQLIDKKFQDTDNKIQANEDKLNEVLKYISTKDINTPIYFFDWQVYDSFSILVQIIKQANKEIIVIDNYIDTGTLDILSKRKDNVKVNIYTSKNYNETEIKKFNKQYGNLTITKNTKFHDRLIILDKTNYYIVWTSLKDAGNTFTNINKIEDQDVQKTILKKLKLS